MKPLFKTLDELKPLLPASNSFTLGQLAPHLVRASSRYIREALGYDQLTELAEAYDRADPEKSDLSDRLVALLAAVRPPLASFAAAYYLPTSGAFLTGSGTKTPGTEQMKPASAQTVASLIAALEQAGYDGLEMLLEFLEENRADYPLWANSEACTIQAGAFLSTAEQFNRLVFIDRSRRRFVELVPALNDVERLVLLPLMGAELLAELHDELKADSVIPTNATLLSYVRPALANLALRGDELRQETGRTYYNELRDFLYAHAADYPLFANSLAYQPAVSTQIKQDANWSFFAAL